ncbi:hypothetical protein Ciccas_001210 [Cichlidogyrus casuarinus]|uniref:Uncharacterized protein n=1 Tax=Cichlidogyrus casuarinus TaxID=1844966 RepID=A0ABD2QL55_9PLAT
MSACRAFPEIMRRFSSQSVLATETSETEDDSDSEVDAEFKKPPRWNLSNSSASINIDQPDSGKDSFHTEPDTSTDAKSPVVTFQDPPYRTVSFEMGVESSVSLAMLNLFPVVREKGSSPLLGIKVLRYQQERVIHHGREPPLEFCH